MIDICICILVSLIILPSFATTDIENRVKYILLNLNDRHMLIIQSFLHKDPIDAQPLLTRVTTIEQTIEEAMNPIRMRLISACFESVRLLQWIYNLNKRNIIDLTLHGLFFRFDRNNLLTAKT